VATAAEREDLVAEAFTRVLQVLRSGRGPAQEFRPYLLVTMRHAAINAARRTPSTALFADVPDSYLPMVTEDPVAARVRGDEAASAFAELPDRWRQVLWHTEVEGASPASIAPMLGMTPNGVAALAYRAREGLRQAYLRGQLPPVVDRGDCRAATDKLAGWVRRSISAPQSRKLAAHLDHCERCSELAAGLREVNGDLGATATPIVSWLSALKSALTVKLGTAAAIAAITAVTVVASEPLIPHDGRTPTVADPATRIPGTYRTDGEIGGPARPSSRPTEAPRPAPVETTPAPTAEPVAAAVEPTTTAKEEKKAAKEEEKAEKKAAKEEKKAEKGKKPAS